jgi:hypothetical protein
VCSALAYAIGPAGAMRLLSERHSRRPCLQVGGGPPLHLLVSAHPLFRHSAFIMGNTNEPVRGPPSTALLELRLKIAADDDPLMRRHGLTQSPGSLAQFRCFAREHPEIEDRSAFFCTRKLKFDPAEGDHRRVRQLVQADVLDLGPRRRTAPLRSTRGHLP